MKLFGKGGKLNVIDIMLIVILIAAIVFAFVALRISSNNDGSTEDAGSINAEVVSQELKFVVVCEDIDEMLANSIMASFSSEEALFDGEGNSIMASFSSEEALFDGEGTSMTRLYNSYKLLDAEVVAWEYKNDNLYMTITGTATHNRGSFSVGTQEVRIGKAFRVKTLGIEIEGTIYSLEKIDG